MEKAHSELEVLCETCSHRKTTVSTLDNLKGDGVKKLSVVYQFTPKCVVHDETQKIFCFSCNKFICRDCTVIDHAGHKYEFVKKAATEAHKKLAEHLTPLKNLLPNLNIAVDRVRDTKQETQAKGEFVKKQVNDKFQELHAILEQCKARLSVLRESEDIIDRKIKKLTIQESNLDFSIGCVQSLVSFVEHMLENASEEELITMQNQVLSGIDSEVVAHGKEADSAYHPVENVDFGVEVFVSEDLKKLCENNVVVYENKLGVKKGGIKVAEVNRSTKLMLVYPITQQKLPVIQATLKSLADETSLLLEAVSVKNGVYSIEYIPKVRGRHHLLISVDGQPITGSPFSVFVKMHPIKFDKPIRKIRKVGPFCLAINSSKEMVVTDNDRHIMLLNKKGERLCSITKSKHGLKTPFGVSLDNDNNIYISDFDKNCVCKFKKSGELLKRIGKEGSGPGEFKHPRGIAVTGDRIYVCDSDNSRIQVLTLELKPVNWFELRETTNGRPVSIAADYEGRLYVSDICNHHIQVFTRDGQFVHSIGKEGGGQGELSGPHGVYVTASYVYVSEYCKRCVSVFTKDGQFVSSFGKGHLVDPCGIFVDSDGFVYVCCDNCIMVF